MAHLGGAVKAARFLAKRDPAGVHDDPSAATSPHAVQEGLGGEQADGGVEMEDPVEIIDRNMVEQRRPDDAVIVDENPDRAVPGNGRESGRGGVRSRRSAIRASA